MNEWHFFDIGFRTLNLFSFMLGATWAFFNQGLFGKKIGQVIFLYFAGLALFYGLSFYAEQSRNQAPAPQTQSSPVVKPEPSPKGGIYKPEKVE